MRLTGALWCNRRMVQTGPARRRGARTPSARSLLLTVLGEFVLPQGASAWTQALVSALAQVDIEEKAARQALSRTAGEGLLAAERDGRRVRWRLTPDGTQLLAEGAERIYGFGDGIADWDGRWLVLTVSVPETQRRLRHSLRTRLTWAGLGSPVPGLWVTPDVSKEKEVAAVVTSLGIEAFSFIGPFGEVGDYRRLVAEAWHLDEVEQRYAQFLKAFASNKIGSRPQAFRSQIRLVQQWRGVPFLDPGLPAQLLPASWPGPRAAALFRQRHERWHDPAQAHWLDLMAAAEQRV
jgi:phenylacetic acid degradation operon negative regulatory protein